MILGFLKSFSWRLGRGPGLGNDQKIERQARAFRRMDAVNLHIYAARALGQCMRTAGWVTAGAGWRVFPKVSWSWNLDQDLFPKIDGFGRRETHTWNPLFCLETLAQHFEVLGFTWVHWIGSTAQSKWWSGGLRLGNCTDPYPALSLGNNGVNGLLPWNIHGLSWIHFCIT